MTLLEIETILAELAYRHENLDGELLHVLLTASGWEDKTIKEAELLFRQHGASFYKDAYKKTHDVERAAIKQSSQNLPEEKVLNTVPEKKEEVATKEEITFYREDGAEEGELHTSPEVITNNKKEEKEFVQEVKSETPTKTIASFLPDITFVDDISSQEKQKEQNIPPKEDVAIHSEKESVTVEVPQIKEEIPQVNQKENNVQAEIQKEPESLIRHDEEDAKAEERKVETKQVSLPGNLPLLPFESSPHVWSFSKYKDVFHGDVMPSQDNSLTKNPLVNEGSTQIIKEKVVVSAEKDLVQKTKQQNQENEEEEISLEKVPMTRGDESLVFLAGVMLLAIILILGYMYSNGRL